MLPEFEIDDRDDDPNASGHREAEFRKGWKDALGPECYRDDTLRKLTWRNLGYRLGRLYGKTSDEMIGILYDWSVRQQQSSIRRSGSASKRQEA